MILAVDADKLPVDPVAYRLANLLPHGNRIGLAVTIALVAPTCRFSKHPDQA